MEIYKKLIERVVIFGKCEDKEKILDYCKQNQLRIVGTGKRPLSKNHYSEDEIKVVAEKDVYPKAITIGKMDITDFRKQENKKKDKIYKNNQKKEKTAFNAPKVSGNKILLFTNDPINSQNKKKENKKFNSQKKR